VVAALAAVVALLSSCADGPAVETGTREVDLIAIFDAARQIVETGEISLASPRKYFYLDRGWSSLQREGEGELAWVAAVSRESALHYRVLQPAERWLSFSVRLQGRLGGPQSQRMELVTGGELLESFEIAGEEVLEGLVHIPAALQRVGDNEILFRFGSIDENPGFLTTRARQEANPYPGISAYFSGFKIYLGRHAAPRMRWIRDDRNVFRLVANGRRIQQRPNSELSYALEVKSGARLDLSGVVQAWRENSGGITVAALIRTDEQLQWSLLWAREFSFRRGATAQAFEADLPLDEMDGRLVELRLRVTGSTTFSNASVTWQRLRLRLPGSESEADPPPRPPVRLTDRLRSVVVIVIDAARADQLGCYGDERGLTPNIDAFARSAVIFRDVVAPCPFTLTSVATLFSGMQPEGHGARRFTSVFPEELENMPRAFRRSGYYTVTITGNTFLNRSFGLTRDCDDVVSIYRDADRESELSAMDVAELERGVAEAAASGKPVFLYVHFLPPHTPYNPPAGFDRPFATETTGGFDEGWRIAKRLAYGLVGADHPDLRRFYEGYLNNLSYADHLTGLLLEMLRRHGLYDDSLIFVTSDHGEAFGEHGEVMHCTTVHDEMILVPLIVRVPGLEPREVRRQVGLIDLFPTLAELLGLELDGAEAQFQGRSIAPLLAGGELPDAYYYSRAQGGNLPVPVRRSPNRDLIFALRGERFKYVHHGDRGELYDIRADPGESHDISAERPVLAAYLRQRGLLLLAASEALSTGRESEIQLSEDELNELRDLGYLQ